MAAKVWWLVHKDLVSECRAQRAWPAMLLSGMVVALVFTLQMQLPPEQQRQAAGGLLWLALFFSGMSTLERSFASEREDGCWEGLLHYPLPASTIYLAKLTVNTIALAVLQGLLILLFVVLCGMPLLVHPWALLVVALLGNVGMAAVGTLVSALAAGIRRGANLSLLLALPMLIPVVLAAAEATRLLLADELGSAWWRWVQLLAAFALVFITAGCALFDYVIED